MAVNQPSDVNAGPKVAAIRLRMILPHRIGAGVLIVVACLLWAPRALATTPTAAWGITSAGQPTHFAPGSSGQDNYVIVATNTGGAPTDGTTITVTDHLPSGLTPDPSGASAYDDAGNGVSCSSAGQQVTCADNDSTPLQPGQHLFVTLPVDVVAGVSGRLTNSVSVLGGTTTDSGAPSASVTELTTVSAKAASFGVQRFDGSAIDITGSADTQAGSHPYAMTTTIYFNTVRGPDGNLAPAAPVKDVLVKLPPGLVGNPSATPKCTQVELDNLACPGASQVGMAEVSFAGLGFLPAGVYNMVPPAGQPAEFAFPLATGATVPIIVTPRTGRDYGLTASIPNISEVLPVTSSTLTFWGVPADPSHDAVRICPGFVTPCSTGAAQKPFLTLPTACLGPQTTTMRTDSWQNPGDFKSARFVSHDNQGHPVGATGCNRLDFTPSLSVRPAVSRADSPSGLSVDLRVPYIDDPNGLAEADLKDATVTLPRGVSVSPSAAEGRKACSEAQIGLHDSKKPSCPGASRVGSVRIDSPLLPDPLTGGVYLAKQDKNPFGSLLAIYVAAHADGVLVKLAGHVVANAKTGELTTTFSDNPQLPFTDFRLSFFGGPRAALATPDACRSYTTTSSLLPWSGTRAQSPSSSFRITSGCVAGFKPSFHAGVSFTVGGAFTPFSLSFARSDADQYFSGLSVKLPAGLLAKLAGVGECTDAELAQAAASSGRAERAHPSCPSSSLVGSTSVGSGPGPLPLTLPGNVYLTGRYKGAPYGLAVVVPAVAGPYDLGTVVVRQALNIDPNTTRVTVVSDPLPQIRKGIPLRLREVQVTLSREHFVLNPTSCQSGQVTGTLTSTQAANAAASSPFKVGGCAGLAFSPKLAIGLSGKGQTHSGKHPTLTATLTQPAHQANPHRVRVTLPLSLALDPLNTKHVCPYQVAKKVGSGPVPCPANSIVGSASAVTPLLSKPLSGKVYLVQGIKIIHGHKFHTLPTLLVALRGQIALNLRSQTAVVGKGALVSDFKTVPDAPVSRFVLTINGGPKGILVITGNHLNICKKPQVSSAKLYAQNGKSESFKIKMGTPCGSGRSRRP
jgi:uncharacterized repeat protein (TIGR01451 family)